jgi:cobalt/nickel transport system permease protein
VHLVDGVIDSGYVLLGTTALAGAGVAIGLWRTDEEKIPQTGVVAAAFFVVSLIHVPLGPVPAHLTLVGLAGLLLGWSVFPAILVGLVLQGVLFGFGGWTTLGINTLTFAVPAVICYYLFGTPLRWLRRAGPWVFVLGFAAGSVGIVLSALLFSGFLLMTGEEFLPTVYFVLAAHVPILFVEGMVTGTIAVSLKRLRPQVFGPLPPVMLKGCPHA